MARKVFALLLLSLCFAYILAAGDCPSSTKVLKCTPKCLHDSECSSIGGKCCPNICNGRSCAEPNQLGNSGSSGSSSVFGNKNNANSGTYCGNVKCGSFERCESDRSTKRPKCVRS